MNSYSKDLTKFIKDSDCYNTCHIDRLMSEFQFNSFVIIIDCDILRVSRINEEDNFLIVNLDSEENLEKAKSELAKLF